MDNLPDIHPKILQKYISKKLSQVGYNNIEIEVKMDINEPDSNYRFHCWMYKYPPKIILITYGDLQEKSKLFYPYLKPKIQLFLRAIGVEPETYDFDRFTIMVYLRVLN
jgi:hypothetical protein